MIATGFSHPLRQGGRILTPKRRSPKRAAQTPGETGARLLVCSDHYRHASLSLRAIVNTCNLVVYAQAGRSAITCRCERFTHWRHGKMCVQKDKPGHCNSFTNRSTADLGRPRLAHIRVHTSFTPCPVPQHRTAWNAGIASVAPRTLLHGAHQLITQELSSLMRTSPDSLTPDMGVPSLMAASWLLMNRFRARMFSTSSREFL